MSTRYSSSRRGLATRGENTSRIKCSQDGLAIEAGAICITHTRSTRQHTLTEHSCMAPPSLVENDRTHVKRWPSTNTSKPSRTLVANDHSRVNRWRRTIALDPNQTLVENNRMQTKSSMGREQLQPSRNLVENDRAQGQSWSLARISKFFKSLDMMTECSQIMRRL